MWASTGGDTPSPTGTSGTQGRERASLRNASNVKRGGQRKDKRVSPTMDGARRDGSVAWVVKHNVEQPGECLRHKALANGSRVLQCRARVDSLSVGHTARARVGYDKSATLSHEEAGDQGGAAQARVSLGVRSSISQVFSCSSNRKSKPSSSKDAQLPPLPPRSSNATHSCAALSRHHAHRNAETSPLLRRCYVAATSLDRSIYVARSTNQRCDATASTCSACGCVQVRECACACTRVRA